MVETNPARAEAASQPQPETDKPESSTAWRLATAPATGVGLGAALGLQLMLAAFVPDDLAHRDLARAVGFGTAEAMSGLGLDDPLRSWLFWLLLLLVALHLTARGLARAARPGRANRFPEALTLIGLGVGGLLAAFVAHQGRGLDALVTVRAGGTAATRGDVEVSPGLVVARALPFSVACGAPDPLDPGFALGCTLETAGVAQEVRLSPGEQRDVAEFSLTLVEAAWTPPGEETASFLWSGEGAPRRLGLKPGATHAVAEGGARQRVEAGVAPSGAAPWLVAASEGAAPSLLWPEGGEAQGAFEAVLPLDLTLRVTSRPGRWLMAVSLALMALGALAGALSRDRGGRP
jgi:hypothetical protein